MVILSGQLKPAGIIKYAVQAKGLSPSITACIHARFAAIGMAGKMCRI